MSISDFNSIYPTPLLEKSHKEDKLCFLMGDFNIDLMKMDCKFNNSKFYNAMRSYFLPLIHQSTRSREKLKTLIDDILFNSFEFTAIPSKITQAISLTI